MAFGFAEHGYVLDRGVLMVQRDEPEREHDLAQVDEVTFEEGPAVDRGDHPAGTVGERRGDRADARRTIGRSSLARSARGSSSRVSRDDRRLLRALRRRRRGQVESVDTLEEFRGRGLASAFVLRAADEGRTMGAEWVHLWADSTIGRSDWYARLGFREVARGSSTCLTAMARPAAPTGPARNPRPEQGVRYHRPPDVHDRERPRPRSARFAREPHRRGRRVARRWGVRSRGGPLRRLDG